MCMKINQRFLDNVKKIVQMNVMSKCCIWCRFHQMHWRLKMMSILLHLMLKSSDALMKLFDCLNCIWCRYHQMHWQLFRCQTVAFDFIAIRWQTVDVQIVTFDRDEIKCIDDVVWLSDCCIQSWNDQMHADDCLKKLSELHLMSMSSNALMIICWCQKNCIWLRTIKCTDEVVCFVACYRTIEQTSCWLDRNVDSLHLIVFLLIWLQKTW